MAQPPMPMPMDSQPQSQPGDDPPSRVARLNWISGDVAFQPATVDAWTNATLNYPLTTGDHLFVNAGGRAELHIGGSAIRLDSNSNFGFLNLNDSIVQMSLNEGSLELRLRQLDQNDTFEIDTPNGAITLLRAGEYRVDTDPARNATMVTVLSGQAQMYQDGNSLLVTPHQTAMFAEGAGPQVLSENPRDAFDGFVASRNNAEDALPRQNYVPDTMIGYEDLYAYGHWVNDPMYGEVWIPPVNPGWTPYSTGRWAFVEPWGWTWVDEAPWGFAPFHYGRWANVRGVGWAWIPGASSYRPVYAPALVGFIGGSGFGVGISVGWFPLGPREPWIPAWGASRRYVNNVNVMHVTNINVVNVTNVNYVNRQNVTVVSQADFAAARPVAAVAVRVSPAQIQAAQVLGSGPRVVPERASVVVGVSRVAPPVQARAVVVRTAPPPAPVSFQARQQALAQNNGLPLKPSQVAQIRAQQPAAVVARPAVRAIASPAPATAAPTPMNRPGPSAPGSAPAGAAPAGMSRPAPSAPMPSDRMNSRPPNAQPLPSSPTSPPVQTRPMQPAPQSQAAPPTDVRPMQRAPQAQPAPPVQTRPMQSAPQSQTAPPADVRPTQSAPQAQPGVPAQTRPTQPAPQSQAAPPADVRPMQAAPQAQPGPPVQTRPMQPAPQAQPGPPVQRNPAPPAAVQPEVNAPSQRSAPDKQNKAAPKLKPGEKDPKEEKK